MSVKLQLKTVLQKSWKAFNTWRKKGMWFRVTVLLLIGISMNLERFFTTDHIPLINELVWIACRAIRYGSEPKVTSAHLRYLHVQNSRKLQKQLFIEYKTGHIKLSPAQQKLLTQSTLNSNYNQLFKLAKNKKLISQNITLGQSKRAMLDKACKLTADRYDHEYANIKKIIVNAVYSGFSLREHKTKNFLFILYLMYSFAFSFNNNYSMVGNLLHHGLLGSMCQTYFILDICNNRNNHIYIFVDT